MAKRRKTRHQKEILKLKRRLAQTQETAPRQEAKSSPNSELKPKTNLPKNADRPVFFYNSSLIKKDLAKTLALTFLVLGLEIVLYLSLK